MDEAAIRDILSGRRRGLAASALRAGLAALSWPYAGLMRLRRWAYRHGLIGSHAAGVPVISIGNVTTGGTGKTPMVAWVVQRLRQAGRDPAILMRGYKADAGVSDEAEMLFKQTGAAVVVNPDRVAAAAAAVKGGVDCLVLDDGFQHRRLRRDLDVVLIDATNPFGFGRVLPRGLLREPVSALRDADAVVITRCDLIAPADLAALRDRLAGLAPSASMHLAGHVVTTVITPSGQRAPGTVLAGKRVGAFCGLGNPEAFFATLAQARADVVATVAFDDHTAYDAAALDRIASVAGDCDILVTTAKDRVKIADPSVLPAPLWTVQVAIGLTEGADELDSRILAAAGVDAAAAARTMRP